MADSSGELRHIAWRDAFPVVRLFGAFSHALWFAPMALAWCAVIALYLLGRLGDGVWNAAGGAVAVVPASGFSSEVEAYALLDRAEFEAYLREASAQDSDASDPATLNVSPLEQALAEISPTTEPADAAAASVIRSPALARAAEIQTQRRATRATGPFAALLHHGTRSLAICAQAAVCLRFGFGDPLAGEPGLLDGLSAMLSGLAWFVTQRPVFAVLYLLAAFAIVSFFGGGIARCAAVQSAREEDLGYFEALGFAREKLGGLIGGPLMTFGLAVLLSLGLIFGAALLGGIGGLLEWIPGGSFVFGWVDELLAAFFFPLALLMSIGVALLAVCALFGTHLTWATIAVEGSDGFDAFQHAASYVGQRFGRLLGYIVVSLVHGALCFVILRGVVLLTFKFTHYCLGAGLGFFGARGANEAAYFPKLDAAWHMPAWADLPWLPSLHAAPLWGWFGLGPLSGSEWVLMIVSMLWVFALVGVLAGFLLSYLLHASVQMYFLLRRDIDAVDYSEIFYEELDDALSAPAPAAPASESGPGPGGTPLPVVGP